MYGIKEIASDILSFITLLGRQRRWFGIEEAKEKLLYKPWQQKYLLASLQSRPKDIDHVNSTNVTQGGYKLGSTFKEQSHFSRERTDSEQSVSVCVS